MSFIKDLGQLQGSGATLRNELAKGSLRRVVTGLKGSSLPLLLARLEREISETESAQDRIAPWLILCTQASEAEAIAEDLRTFGAKGVEFFPELEILPFDRHNADHNIVSQRVEVLEALTEGRVRFLVTSVRAWLRKVLPPEVLTQRRIKLSAGDELDLDEFAERLSAIGYRRVGMVEEPGDFAVKGGILDLFTPTCEEPFRLEFFGDELESLRRFDPGTQISTKRVDSVNVLPCSQVLLGMDDRHRAVRELHKLYPAESLLTEDLAHSFLEGIAFEGLDRYSAYFVPEAPLSRYLQGTIERPTLLIDEGALRERWNHMSDEIERRYKKGIKADDLLPEPDSAYLPRDAFDRLLASHNLLMIEDELAESLASPRAPVLKMGTKGQPAFGSSVNELRSNLADLSKQGYRLWIYCDNKGQADRLTDIISDQATDLHLPVGDLQNGFLIPAEKICIYTDHEIFDRYKRLRRRRRLFKGAGPIRDRATLRTGDFVVHVQHGVAKYKGMKKLDVLGEEREVLHLAYADEQQLYIPVEQIHLVERYSSKEDGTPRLNRLGEKAWIKTRQKAEKAIKEMAADLLRLYAMRESSKGFAYPEDTPWQKELEASFLYQDTPDQATAAAETKKDMQAERPMDRLVCGDVGFGKTEVAIRAAFKAVQAGKQVAVLVPTTILAQQHLQTFGERLRDYPVRIDMVSRFRTSKQIKETVSALSRGEVDIIVGTHRLLSADVAFKDLGLLIVDEEHRFGVAHKEKLKRARAAVDCVALTATPIPRTLHMSLGGIRDISLIRTPPRDRLPVHTEIIAFDEELMRDAILREVDRGGQAFFVHNRVETIEAMGSFLQKLLPDVRIRIGQGQMSEKELEKVMVDFIDGKFEVLLSTMIIESGLDIPRVNTILINRADRFGLAQLHQLRGRVGRSRQRAYAYLMIPADRSITDDSRRRLDALVEHDELGAGYKLALRDLEIRGAGNMLGAQQHGHISAVGFDLYLRLVSEAVRQLKDGKSFSQDTRVESHLQAHLPDDYVEDPEQKMILYQKMGHVDGLERAEAMKSEVRDRFGPLPESVENLFVLLDLKILAQSAGIARVDLRGRPRLELQEGATLAPKDIARLSEEFSGALEFKGSSPPVLELKAKGERGLKLARALLVAMAGSARSVVPS